MTRGSWATIYNYCKDKQISDLTKQVQALEDKTEELEQYSRRNSLRIELT